MMMYWEHMNEERYDLRSDAASGFRVRWAIFAFLFGFALLGYVQRTGVAIAAARMVPELGLTPADFGWLLDAFLISYTVFQLPGAIVGQRLGSHRTLTAIGWLTVAAAAATALAPSGHASLPVFALVLLARFLLGTAQAALYPVESGAIESWFPRRRWGLCQGILVMGMWLGAAVTPPLIAWLMTHWGWRVALIASSACSIPVVWLWHRYGRDKPSEHPQVGAAELEELRGNPPVVDSQVKLSDVLKLLRNRHIALLTLSYSLMNYVFYLVTFWCFLYLVQERHFTLLEGGVLASLPFVAAALAAGAGGQLCDRLSLKYGARVGLRSLPLAALPASAGFLVLTGVATSDYLAVAALCLAFACTELNEGPYWVAAMRIAPQDVMASTAVLNTGGNLGGVVATPTIALLSAGHHWTSIFGLGAALSVLAALLWLLIDCETAGAETAPPARTEEALRELRST
jgi:MFS transporter, ACS family, glucarate transporter